MTSQRVERTWIRTGGYRRFRGEWVKCDEKCKLDQVFVVHLQELSLLIKFKLTFYYIEAVQYITSLFCSSLKLPYNWAFFEVDFNINIHCLLIN